MYGENIEPAPGGHWHEPKLATSALLLWLDNTFWNAQIGNRKTTVIGSVMDGAYRLTDSFGPAARTLTIGHSIFTVAFGLIGGWLANRLVKRNDAD
jgi:hypothetical protein